ncbi:MAG: radical SAM protein [Muribaculaceae bacterium]|nr:radical SAM protein [Muribaculaceae bacterium]
MKSSQYNIIVKNKEKNSICYNTRLDAFCILTNEDAELLKNDVKKLYLKAPRLVESMYKNNFIVDDDCNELYLLEQEYKKAINDSSVFYLTILPSLDCNLRCWYCFEKHIKGSHLTPNVSNAILTFVRNKLKDENLKELNVELFGGEPLLYFKSELYPLLKKIREESIKVGKKVSFFFVTNAVCINKENIHLFEELESSFQISIDGSKERHDKIKYIPDTGEGTYESMIKTLYSLTNRLNNVYINLRINYDDETIPKMPELITQLNEIDRNKIGIHLERVWQTERKVFDNEQLESIISKWLEAGFKVSYMNMGRRSFSCKASAKNQVVISWDGSVYKCSGRDFTDAHKEGELLCNGSIKWDNEKLKKRIDIVTFDNDMCKECKFLPLCWGPCCQKQMECKDGNLNRYCQKRNMEMRIAEYVKYRFNNAYVNPTNYREWI